MLSEKEIWERACTIHRSFVRLPVGKQSVRDMIAQGIRTGFVLGEASVTEVKEDADHV